MASAVHSALTTHYSLFCTPRARAHAAFSLVEILIALFVFLIGILGVLAVFPVAMNSASKAIGDVRANILADSTLAQLMADCRVPWESGGAGAGATATSLVRGAAATARPDYFVTLTSGGGKGQSRRITADDGTTMTVDPAWTTAGGWTAPESGDGYVVTRLGLPDPPVGAQLREFGLQRMFYVRAFNAASDSTIELGRLETLDPVSGTAAGGGNDYLTGSGVTWQDDQYNNCTVFLTGGTGAGQRRLITDTVAATSRISIAPATWTTNPDTTTTYEILSVRSCYRHETATVLSADTDSVTAAANFTAPAPQDNKYADQFVRVTSGKAAGQVRRIRRNDASTLWVTAAWEPGALPEAGDPFEIGWPDNTLESASAPYAGFLVVMSGRDAGRIFPITDTNSTGTKLEVTCAGAEFPRLALSVAQRRIRDVFPGSDPQDFSYKPSDADTVAVVGNSGAVRTVLPRSDTDPYTPDDFNTLGDTTKEQTRYDVFGAAKAYGSEYSVVAVFSDSGVFPGGPVRVDVFTFRNYDSSKGLAENRRPVGFLTGYIRRP